MPERLRGFTTRRYINPLYLYLYLYLTKNLGLNGSGLERRLPSASINLSIIISIIMSLLCVVLGDFPHSQHRPSVIHIGLQLPIIRGVQSRRWNFRKADWASYTLATERSISLIPVNNISVEESCVSSLVPSVLHLSRGFQCSPTLNRQPYEGRLLLTIWWRKSSNMTVGQSSLISLAHHCYD